MAKIIAQGAEAKILLSDNFIIKDRISKSYRIKELDDKIRKQRTKGETKLLLKASEIINAQKPLEYKSDYQIKMPFINGKKLSEHLNSFPIQKQKEICKKIGKEIAKLHDVDIIHGDLTTSNMILVEEDKKKVSDKNVEKYIINNSKKSMALTNSKLRNLAEPISEKYQSASEASLIRGGGRGRGGIAASFQIFFIDFGLGFISNKFEDKAVDLHLLKQALEAKHFQNWETLWKEVEKGYVSSKNSKQVLDRLKSVEARGRYKEKCSVRKGLFNK